LQIVGLYFLRPPAGHHGSAAGVFSAPPTVAIRTRETGGMLLLLFSQTSGIAIASNFQKDIITWNGGGAFLLTWVVPIGGLGNTVGRLIFGQIENMYGFRKALMVNAALLAVLQAAVAIEENANRMVVLMFFMWLTFGGNFPLFVANVQKTFGPQFFAMNYAMVFFGFGGGGLLIGMTVKSWLPLLSSVPSEAIRIVFGVLSAQAVLVFAVLAAGVVRSPAQVQVVLKERLDASLLELEAK
jgi:MFS family permease